MIRAWRAPSIRGGCMLLAGSLAFMAAACTKPGATGPKPDPLGPPQQHAAHIPVDAEDQKALRAGLAKIHALRMQKAFVTPEEAACTVDADCTLTHQQCCSCPSGGRYVGVSKKALKGVLERRAKLCKEAVCTARVSQDPTCIATAATCSAGRCVVKPAAPRAAAQGIGVAPIAPESLHVAARMNGEGVRLTVGKTEVNLEGLRAQVKKGQSVVLQVAPDVPHGEALKVLDALRAQGITRVTLSRD